MAKVDWRSIKKPVRILAEWSITPQTRGRISLILDNKTSAREIEYCKVRENGREFGFRYFPLMTWPEMVLADITAYQALAQEVGFHPGLEAKLR